MSEKNFLIGLGLSKQIVDTLHKAGVKSQEDLLARRDSLRGIRGIGEQTVKTLLAALDGPAAQVKPAPEPGLGAGDEAEAAESTGPRPVICPYHNVACEQQGGDLMFARFACPEKGCSFLQKVPHTDIVQRARRLRMQEEDFSARADRA